MLLMVAISCSALCAVPRADAAQVAERRIELAPLRVAADAAPGDATTVQLRLANKLDSPVNVELSAIDLTAGTGDALAQPASRSRAAGWVSFEQDERRLAAGATVPIAASIQVPASADPGTYPLAIVVASRQATLGGSSADRIGSRVEASTTLGSIVVLDVAGDADRSLTIANVASPRIVLGGDDAVFRVTVENSGARIATVGTSVRLPLVGGADAQTLRAEPDDLLPDGSRTIELRWEDRPWLGIATPTVVATGGTAPVTAELPRVLVLPPLWVIITIVVALLIPIAVGQRRKHRRRRTRR